MSLSRAIEQLAIDWGCQRADALAILIGSPWAPHVAVVASLFCAAALGTAESFFRDDGARTFPPLGRAKGQRSGGGESRVRAGVTPRDKVVPGANRERRRGPRPGPK